LSFLELGAGALASRQQLTSSTRKSWTGHGSRQELDSGQNLDQDHRQNKEQGPLQKPAVDRESERDPREPSALD